MIDFLVNQEIAWEKTVDIRLVCVILMSFALHKCIHIFNEWKLCICDFEAVVFSNVFGLLPASPGLVVFVFQLCGPGCLLLLASKFLPSSWRLSWASCSCCLCFLNLPLSFVSNVSSSYCFLIVLISLFASSREMPREIIFNTPCKKTMLQDNRNEHNKR